LKAVLRVFGVKRACFFAGAGYAQTHYPVDKAIAPRPAKLLPDIAGFVIPSKKMCPGARAGMIMDTQFPLKR
jgi:hypothetical protein